MFTTSEICPVSLGEPLTLKTRMLRKKVQVFIPFEQTKSLLMRLPVALQSRRALIEYCHKLHLVISPPILRRFPRS